MADPNRDGVREYNSARVLAAVRDGAATSRAELGELTGLSRSTITAIVADLLAQGAVVESVPDSLSDGDRRAGRPIRRLRVAPREEYVVAVDFGHSHCRVGIVDSGARVVVDQARSLDVDSSAEAALAYASRTIDRLLAELGPDRARVVGGGIGLPAPVNAHTGMVGPGNVLPKWADRHPAEELQQRLGLPVTVDNDANLGALAELEFGAAHGLSDLIYVKASTGIGAGLVLGGRLYRGSTGRAGEIGHVPVEPNGPLCRCGNRGCLETVASVTQVLGTIQPRHDRPVTVARLVELVADGDAGALRVLGDAGRLIGRVLADVVNNLNPELVVLGGELSLVSEPVLAGVRESIERFAQPVIARDVRVQVSELGADAQLLGAAALALRSHAAR
jgi:predicted NBD/HSP70 family sugar kinase/biotin operon repressor